MEEAWSHPTFKTREEFDERLRQVISEEQDQPFMWWYLSFATDTEFLGGLYIPASGIAEAVTIARILGLNPGGEVMGHQIPADMKQHFDEHVPMKDRLRLLTKEEVEGQG